MKRKMLVALSVALTLALAPVGGQVMMTVAAEGLQTGFKERTHYESVSGNEMGSVSDNDGGSVSDGDAGSVSGNDIPQEGNKNENGGTGDNNGSGNNQENTNNGSGNPQNTGEVVTTGPSVTVTDSDGKQIVTTIPAGNSSSQVQSVAIITPKTEVNLFAGLTGKQMEEGQYVAMLVSDSQCGENARNVINNAAMSVKANVATILEIDLGIFLQSGEQIGKVTDLNQAIQFTISTPSDISNPEKYDFAMVHLHDGAVNILPDLDKNPATITVETDGFSVYAVVYGEPGSFDAFRTAGVKDNVPKTGTVLPWVFPAVATGVLLGVTAVVVWKKKKEA